jgi:hypothetical protein
MNTGATRGPLHHVLLIGIDDYYTPNAMLRGCVNDIDAVQEFLLERLKLPKGQITRLAAPRDDSAPSTDVDSAFPTLVNIRAAFEKLGSNAVQDGDSVFIYYSGHGTQCPITDGGGGRSFTREALLPQNNVEELTRNFVFDWELNGLIAAIAKRTSAVTMVLDCCSSAGVTRSIDSNANKTSDRFVATTEPYALGEKARPNPRVRGITSALGSVQSCQVIAACRDHQRARESPAGDGRVGGELTRALVDALMRINPTELGDLRWGRIWREIEAAVTLRNPRQTPWLFGDFNRRVFGLGGNNVSADRGYRVQPLPNKPNTFELDVGSLAGVTIDAEISVYGDQPPQFPPLGKADEAARRGLLRVVTHSDRARAEAVAVAPFAMPAAPRGRLSKTGRAARLRVALAPHDQPLAAELGASDLIEVLDAQNAKLAELVLVKSAAGWILTDDIHGDGTVKGGEPILFVLPHAAAIDKARAIVEHYLKYRAPLRFAEVCGDLPNKLVLSVLDVGNAKLTAEQAQNPSLPNIDIGPSGCYELADGNLVCVAVDNRSDRRLSISLFDCAPSGRVFLLGEKPIDANGRHVFWCGETLGTPFEMSVPAGATVGIDRVVAIGTTREDRALAHLASAVSFADILQPPPALRGVMRGVLRSAATVEAWTSTTACLRVTKLKA